jgi:hypothetical protein
MGVLGASKQQKIKNTATRNLERVSAKSVKTQYKLRFTQLVLCLSEPEKFLKNFQKSFKKVSKKVKKK